MTVFLWIFFCLSLLFSVRRILVSSISFSLFGIRQYNHSVHLICITLIRRIIKIFNWTPRVTSSMSWASFFGCSFVSIRLFGCYFLCLLVILIWILLLNLLSNSTYLRDLQCILTILSFIFHGSIIKLRRIRVATATQLEVSGILRIV